MVTESSSKGSHQDICTWQGEQGIHGSRTFCYVLVSARADEGQEMMLRVVEQGGDIGGSTCAIDLPGNHQYPECSDGEQTQTSWAFGWKPPSKSRDELDGARVGK